LHFCSWLMLMQKVFSAVTWSHLTFILFVLAIKLFECLSFQKLWSNTRLFSHSQKELTLVHSSSDDSIREIDVAVVGKIIIDEYYGQNHPVNGSNPLNIRLGGGSVQAAFGARLWNNNVGIVAPFGKDFDEKMLETFKAFDIDTSGISILAEYLTPTVKVWYEGENMHFHGSSGWDRWDDLLQEPIHLPPSYNKAKVLHAILEKGGSAEADVLCAQRRLHPDCLISVEPVFIDSIDSELCNRVARTCCFANVVSPDWNGACQIASMEENSSPEVVLPACARVLQMKGINFAQVLIVRRGSIGSYLWCSVDPSSVHHIPALTGIKVVDPTGAGNAFAGAFASVLGTALWKTPQLSSQDLLHLQLDAARKATLTGAITVESDGLPQSLEIAKQTISEKDTNI